MNQPNEGSVAVPGERSFFGHPAGLGTLFFTEMWERFSYYGMRALLVLFMVAAIAEGGLGFDDKTAAAIYGLYTAAVYLAALPGGCWPTGYSASKMPSGMAASSLQPAILCCRCRALPACPSCTGFISG